MSGKSGASFSDLHVYQRYEELSDLLWNAVGNWKIRSHLNIGDQALRAVDSIGANIAESVGRAHHKESLHHLFYARGSLLETQHWIRVAVRRKIIDEATVTKMRSVSLVLIKQLNSFIRAQRARHAGQPPSGAVSDSMPLYGRKRNAKSASSKSQEPRAKSQEPRAKSQEPRAKSQEPRPCLKRHYFSGE